jgi:hypothetical protein
LYVAALDDARDAGVERRDPVELRRALLVLAELG